MNMEIHLKSNYGAPKLNYEAISFRDLSPLTLHTTKQNIDKTLFHKTIPPRLSIPCLFILYWLFWSAFVVWFHGAFARIIVNQRKHKTVVEFIQLPLYFDTLSRHCWYFLAYTIWIKCVKLKEQQSCGMNWYVSKKFNLRLGPWS